MKNWLWIPICLTLLFSARCASHASEQSDKIQPATISTSENNTSEDDEPLWAQPVEEHGQLFTGLNLVRNSIGFLLFATFIHPCKQILQVHNHRCEEVPMDT